MWLTVTRRMQNPGHDITKDNRDGIWFDKTKILWWIRAFLNYTLCYETIIETRDKMLNFTQSQQIQEPTGTSIDDRRMIAIWRFVNF